jgi:hypothetical protein
MVAVIAAPSSKRSSFMGSAASAAHCLKFTGPKGYKTAHLFGE